MGSKDFALVPKEREAEICGNEFGCGYAISTGRSDGQRGEELSGGVHPRCRAIHPVNR